LSRILQPHPAILIARCHLLPLQHVRLFDAFSSREPVPTSLENALSKNNPLMMRREHWKSSLVLPMFPITHWRPVPVSGDARLNAARSTRLEMPLWMK
jgi:hypothetical protein